MYTCTCNAHCTCIHVYTCTCIYSVHVHCMHVYTCSYMYMYIVYTCTLCAKCSFAPSADFDAQTLDPHFAQLITLCIYMYMYVYQGSMASTCTCFMRCIYILTMYFLYIAMASVDVTLCLVPVLTSVITSHSLLTQLNCK